MRTTISLPDDLFRQTDRLAKKMKLTRSALIAKAVEAFIASQRDDEVNRSLRHEDGPLLIASRVVRRAYR